MLLQPRRRRPPPPASAYCLTLLCVVPGVPQELVEDYLSHLERPGTPSKTFRIRVFVFMAAEDPLTPDEIMEGQTFFRCDIVIAGAAAAIFRVIAAATDSLSGMPSVPDRTRALIDQSEDAFADILDFIVFIVPPPRHPPIQPTTPIACPLYICAAGTHTKPAQLQRVCVRSTAVLMPAAAGAARSAPPARLRCGSRSPGSTVAACEGTAMHPVLALLCITLLLLPLMIMGMMMMLMMGTMGMHV